MSLLGISSFYVTLADHPLDSFLKDLENHKLPVGEVLDFKSTSLNGQTARLLKNVDHIKLTVHSPLDTEKAICSPDGSVRRTALRKLKQSIDYSAEIGATAFVQHPGLKISETNNNGWELNSDALLSLIDYGSSRDVKVLVENMPTQKSYMSAPSEFMEFMKANKVNLQMVFDIGHAHIAGNVDEYLQSLATHFFMVHITDNDGTSDSHLNVGEGTIDWDRAIPSLKERFSGVYIVEALNEPIRSVHKLSELLK